jgi:hypothetical protein
VKHGPRQLNVAKVAGTLRHALTARLALEVAVDGAHSRIHQSAHLRLPGRLVHDLGMLDLGDRIGFLKRRQLENIRILRSCTNYLFRREDAKLDLLDFAQRRRRVRELVTKHDGRRDENRGRSG